MKPLSFTVGNRASEVSVHRNQDREPFQGAPPTYKQKRFLWSLLKQLPAPVRETMVKRAQGADFRTISMLIDNAKAVLKRTR